MTKLEQIALTQLAHKLYSALNRCSVKNADRMNFERIFIEQDIKQALEIVQALDENNDYEEKQPIRVQTIGT